MAETFKVLAQGQVAAAAGAIYTTPGATQAIIKQMIFLNVTGGSLNLTVFVNGTAAANQIFGPGLLGAGESVVFDGTLPLNAAESVRALAGAATSITYTILGMEIT